jgi:hypothetical protein
MRHRLGPRRTRQLVEECEPVTLRLLTQRRPDGATVAGFNVSGAGGHDETYFDARTLLVSRRQRALGGERIFQYLACPRCGSRRRALFTAHVGRGFVLWCRRCLALHYQSQTRERWDGRLLERLQARADALRRGPGPKGAGYRAWCRRLSRVQVLEQAAAARALRRAVAEASQLARLMRRDRKGQGGRNGQGSAWPPVLPSAPTRAPDVERLARQTARESYPPAPPTAWKRRNDRRRLSGTRPAPEPPSPTRPTAAGASGLAAGRPGERLISEERPRRRPYPIPPVLRYYAGEA